MKKNQTECELILTEYLRCSHRFALAPTASNWWTLETAMYAWQDAMFGI